MHDFVIAQLDSAKLIVDSTVQRRLDQRKVDKIAAEFSPDALGVITVSRRAGGAHHVIDGQHRVAAVEVLGGDTVTCRVFDNLSLSDEAAMFRLLNNTTAPQRIDLFRVRVIEGEPVAVSIADMLVRHGWKLQAGTGSGSFAAVSAAERIYRASPIALEKAIATLTAAWGHDNTTVHGCIVEGVGKVYTRYGTAVDIADFTDRLARYPGGAGGLIGKARGWRDMSGGTLPGAVAEIVVNQYNARRRTRALPDWKAS